MCFKTDRGGCQVWKCPKVPELSQRSTECKFLYICSAQSENLDNSGIALRKVRIPKLADRVRILTLHGTIPELSVRKVRIGTK